MTREQKIEAYAMILDGCSVTEVGDRFGVSRQYISYLFPSNDRAVQKSILESCIYPNIAEWMKENRVGLSLFARTAGIDYAPLYRALTGKTYPRKKVIDAILRATGLSYEEAFYQPEEEPKC